MSLVTGGNTLNFATSIDNSGLSKGIRSAQGILRGFVSNIDKMDVFAGLSLGAAVAFKNIATDAFNMSKEFETSMLEIKTISQATQDDFSGMSDAIMQVGLEVPQSADELAKAYYQIASAGYDGAAGLNLLEVSSKAAIGGITDVKTAADGVTTIMNAWKISADGAEGITDKLFKTVQLGKTTFPELSNNISQVASIASSASIPLEQILAAVASLTKQGVPTSQAFTQIRSALLSTNKVLGDGWSKTMTFQEGMQAIAEKAGGSQKELRDMVGRVEAMNAVLGLTGKNAQMASSDLLLISDSAGAAGQAFDTMVESAENQSKLLAANIEAAFKPLGDFILKNYKEITTFLNEAFQSGDIEKFAKVIGTAVTGLVAYKTAAKLSSISIMDLKKGFDIAKKAMQELNLSMKVNPIGLLAAGIAAAATAWVLFRDKVVKAEKGMLDLSRAGNEYKKTSASVVDESKALFLQLENSKKGTIAYKNALAKVNEKYGEYLPNLLTEKSSLVEIKDAQKLVNEQLLKNVAIKSKSTELNAVFLKQIAVEKDLHKLTARLQQDNIKSSLDAESKLKEVAKSMADLGQTSNTQIEQMGKGLTAMFGLNASNSNAISDLLGKYVRLYTEVNKGTSSIEEFYKQLLSGIDDVKDVEDEQSGIIEKNIKQQKRKNDGLVEELATKKKIVIEQKKLAIDTDKISTSTPSIESDWEGVAELIQEGAEGLHLMGQAISQLNSKLGRTIQDMADIAQNVSEIVKGIVSQNYFQVATSAASLVIKLFTIRKRKAEEAQKAEEEALQQQKELFASITSTTSESITDSILEGFKNGKFAAEDFADNFKDLMKNAMLESFKIKFLQKQFDNFYTEFGKASESGGGLTEAEIADLKERFNSNIENAQAGFDAFNAMFEDVFGKDASPSNQGGGQGMAGEIKASLTEQTGTVLAGTMNSIRLFVQVQNEILEDMNGHLLLISNNTANNVELQRLENIEALLSEQAQSLRSTGI